jgi:hypothetical protein
MAFGAPILHQLFVHILHTPTGSPILHSGTSLFFLQLRLALWDITLLAGITTTHASKSLLHTHYRGIGSVHRVQWDHNPQPPGPVIEEADSDDASLGPVKHIPHILRQASCVKVLAGGAKGTIFVVAGPAHAVQIVFNGKRWNCQKEVWLQ